MWFKGYLRIFGPDIIGMVFTKYKFRQLLRVQVLLIPNPGIVSIHHAHAINLQAIVPIFLLPKVTIPIDLWLSPLEAV